MHVGPEKPANPTTALYSDATPFNPFTSTARWKHCLTVETREREVGEWGTSPHDTVPVPINTATVVRNLV